LGCANGTKSSAKSEIAKYYNGGFLRGCTCQHICGW